MVAAIAIAGMAVAFPMGIGLALVIGSVLNYVITPKGNPLLLFGGVALVCVAIVLDALAYRKLSGDAKVTTKGIVLSLLWVDLAWDSSILSSPKASAAKIIWGLIPSCSCLPWESWRSTCR